MNVLITFGPASAPIDEVRRITNHSTGALGTLLTTYFNEKGHSVTAFRGTQATAPAPQTPCLPFSTNLDLQQKLLAHSNDHPVDLLLHAAALTDYEVESCIDSNGNPLAKSQKIKSSLDSFQIKLKRSIKLLPHLRECFPKARIVGWKYELDGTREQAIERGLLQIQENQTDLCVVNGTAYGPGFGICSPHQDPIHLNDDTALAQWLERW